MKLLTSSVASHTDSVAWLKDFSVSSMYLISIDAAKSWFCSIMSALLLRFATSAPCLSTCHTADRRFADAA